MTKVIVVNYQDQILGYQEKKVCHQIKGILHRAFSIFIVNKKKEILMQKRSKNKPLWSFLWSNTCCSHPKKGESYIQAGQRRLKEEMGFTCPLKPLYKFHYQASDKNRGSENEICTVLLGQDNAPLINPNKKEVVDYRWLSLAKLKREINQKPDNFTHWLKIIIKDKRFSLK